MAGQRVSSQRVSSKGPVNSRASKGKAKASPSKANSAASNSADTRLSSFAVSEAISDEVAVELRQQLLTWYAEQGRDLPWRRSRDPYAIWISEIMLQQTQVKTVIPYYERWLEKFPTVHDLAAAEQQTVLKLWEGLGYYARARNLHKAAQQVVSDFDGEFPQTLADAMSLKGIGRTTAGGILSAAFDLPTAILDGNVKRVLSRIVAFSAVPNKAL